MAEWLNRRGIKKDWDCLCLDVKNAGEVLRNFHAPEHWGYPVSAVLYEKTTWFSDGNSKSDTKVVAGLYSNGQVCDVRFTTRGGWRTNRYPAVKRHG